MGVTCLTRNVVIFLTFVLIGYCPFVVNGLTFCKSSSIFEETKICSDNTHCCGIYNNECCDDLNPFQSPPGLSEPIDRSQQEAMELFSAFVTLMILTFCCVCCYRCCCRRTISRGFVYSTPGATTSMSVSLPPQQPQHVPYPTVVPYPQQTPYPPQYNPPTNPYYGMPPPAYGVAVQSESQHAPAPSAPYIQS